MIIGAITIPMKKSERDLVVRLYRLKKSVSLPPFVLTHSVLYATVDTSAQIKKNPQDLT